jgi:hypothetical protein
MTRFGRAILAAAVVGALLNVPFWVGNSDAGGGGLPAGAGGNGAGGDENEVVCGNGRAGPPAPATILFPFTGGTDSSYHVQAPRGCRVLNASFDLEGRSATPPPVLRKYDISDGKNNDAWEGVTSDCPPTGGPGSFQQQQFASDGFSDVSSEDGSAHGTLTYAIGAPYQLFKFKVTEDNVTSLTVKWVGTGWDVLMDTTEASVYIYN